MSNPKIKTNYATTYHRDGTVSYWDCLQEQWQRQDAGDIRDEVLTTLNDIERSRIAAMAAL